MRQKPCYIRKDGRPKGSYLRTGDGDYKMTMYEIDRFMENQYRMARSDVAIVDEATVDDLDQTLLNGWLNIQRGGSFGGTASMGDEQLMVNRRVLAYDAQDVLRPTVAGLPSRPRRAVLLCWQWSWDVDIDMGMKSYYSLGMISYL